MQLLATDKQDLLEAQGFEIAEFTGFDQHSLPLYAHRELGDKKPGDVVMRVRVGNPESLDDGEATYLARKAFHGMFPWQPGAECSRRTFVEVKFSETGEAIREEGQAKGCRWCRKSKAAGKRGSRAAPKGAG